MWVTGVQTCALPISILTVRVTDSGIGLPAGSSAPPTSGLGMQIVDALLTDVQGSITWDKTEPHGTSARFVVRLRAVSEVLD